MLEAIDIANYFVNLGLLNNIPITNMKLQKMLYIANGMKLAYFDESLFRENIEAWKYGPVVPSVYQRFKNWGDRPIDSPQPTGNLVLEDKDQKILAYVWNITKDADPIKLSNWSHNPDSPWDVTFKKAGCLDNCNAYISPDYTKEYFRKEFQIIPQVVV